MIFFHGYTQFNNVLPTKYCEIYTSLFSEDKDQGNTKKFSFLNSIW